MITKLFLPGQELLASGISRAETVVRRVLDMSEDAVESCLAAVVELFGDRHPDLTAVFEQHYALVASELAHPPTVSAARGRLIGAYCTQEYSVEAAALLNPSMVAHPDQTGLAPGELRFVMSVRGVGEGHLSSIEFRTGIIGPAGIAVDEPGRCSVTGVAEPALLSRDFFREALATRADAAEAEPILVLLRAHFSATRLHDVLETADRSADRHALYEQMRQMAAGHYEVTFGSTTSLSQRVLYPTSADERRGMEDARFTTFVDDDGAVRYLGVYTAFDGERVAPRLIRTDRFDSFEICPLTGPAAQDKGMALFPRRIDGRYVALSRWDRESIGIATSTDGRNWGAATTVERPSRAWDLIQLGNCGSPLETAAGWLVLTHGVGPVRTYGIGAILLDLADPARLIGALPEPLLTPSGDEREGYVPNVVYTCGGLIHGETLVIPYGCSDSSIRFAFVSLPELLGRLQSTGTTEDTPPAE